MYESILYFLLTQTEKHISALEISVQADSEVIDTKKKTVKLLANAEENIAKLEVRIRFKLSENELIFALSKLQGVFLFLVLFNLTSRSYFRSNFVRSTKSDLK